MVRECWSPIPNALWITGSSVSAKPAPPDSVVLTLSVRCAAEPGIAARVGF
ncbi:MAG: hypothetical protein JWN96_4353 [Mycobacterium sp.]|nr:hypothetical protein [Mycobacterium sp.]